MRSAAQLLAVAVFLAAAVSRAATPPRPWQRHVIDDSSRGADGIRLADVNGDGRTDLVTAWEEGGVIRAYLNPGPAKSRLKWPAVTVGEVGDPEDAVFVDLDGDGAVDVVSSSEGRVRTLWAHWAPKDPRDYLNPKAWKTEPFPALQGAMMWMYALPMQVDGKHGVDLVCGAKGAGAQVGWLESPVNPRDLSAWKWHPLYDAGWIMSLESHDVDGDGDRDIVVSDRRGDRRGCLWLENPGPARAAEGRWKEHRLGPPPGEVEVMFLAINDLDGDGLQDVVVAALGSEFLFIRRQPGKRVAWETHRIALPPVTGRGKAVHSADIDLDGRMDVISTAEGAGGKSGVIWLSYRDQPTDRQWEAHDISGPEGIKFDLIQLLDLDEDGDLDVLTCEERTNLGVIWYENPTR